MRPKSALRIKNVNSQGLFTSDGKGHKAAVGARKVTYADFDRRPLRNQGAGCRGVQTDVGKGQTRYPCGFESRLFGSPRAQQIFFGGGMDCSFFRRKKASGHSHKLLPRLLYVYPYRPAGTPYGECNRADGVAYGDLGGRGAVSQDKERSAVGGVGNSGSGAEKDGDKLCCGRIFGLAA